MVSNYNLCIAAAARTGLPGIPPEDDGRDHSGEQRDNHQLGRHRLDCGQTGSTLMGPLQKVMIVDSLGKKVRPGTLG